MGRANGLLLLRDNGECPFIVQECYWNSKAERLEGHVPFTASPRAILNHIFMKKKSAAGALKLSSDTA